MWNKRFLGLATYVASWSKDPSTKVGAVIADSKNRIVSLGFNGFARGVNDDERLNNRNTKYAMILHAEENAIMFAGRDLSDCRLYVSGLPPCSHCASFIVQSGIKKVYAWKQEIPERWQESFEITKNIFAESGVDLEFIEKDR